MGWLKVACAVAAGAVAVKAAKAVIETDDPDVLISSAVICGVSGATAYKLAKSELNETHKETAMLNTIERKLLNG